MLGNDNGNVVECPDIYGKLVKPVSVRNYIVGYKLCNQAVPITVDIAVYIKWFVSSGC